MTGVCVEWAQARARAARWAEEVMLLVEEMRRVLSYMMWRKEWWQKQGELREETRQDVKEGLKAYAMRQGLIVKQLADKFAGQWHPLLMHRKLPVEWPEDLGFREKPGSGKGKEDLGEGENWNDMEEEMDVYEMEDEML
jgi:hypothetical protein